MSGSSVGYREPGKIQRHSPPRGKMPGGEGGDLDYKLWGPWELPALMADTVTGRRSFFLASGSTGSDQELAWIPAPRRQENVSSVA